METVLGAGFTPGCLFRSLPRLVCGSRAAVQKTDSCASNQPPFLLPALIPTMVRRRWNRSTATGRPTDRYFSTLRRCRSASVRRLPRNQRGNRLARKSVSPPAPRGGYRGFYQSRKTHFLFCSLCNKLRKRTLNRFKISGIWLQAHFEIIEDRLLVGFRCGDFLELHVTHHDLVAPDRR
jgi:hypothetical protein